MVADERERHRVPRDELVLAHDGALLHGADGEDRACGGLMIAVKLATPYMPRFDTVNVPPPSSGGVIVASRTRAASERVSRAISPSAFCVGVEHGRHDERVVRRPRRRRR